MDAPETGSLVATYLRARGFAVHVADGVTAICDLEGGLVPGAMVLDAGAASELLPYIRARPSLLCIPTVFVGGGAVGWPGSTSFSKPLDAAALVAFLTAAMD